MMLVIFEVELLPGAQQRYLDAAAALRPLLAQVEGFIAIERFESLSQPGKLLSLSTWRDEAAIAQWRNLEVHRRTQRLGREHLFADYRVKVAAVLRDYGQHERAQALADSRCAFAAVPGEP